MLRVAIAIVHDSISAVAWDICLIVRGHVSPKRGRIKHGAMPLVNILVVRLLERSRVDSHGEYASYQTSQSF